MYNLAKIAVSKCSKQAIAAFEHGLAIDKRHTKSLYAYVNQQSPATKRINAMRDSSGNIVTDERFIANILNEQYRSVFTREPPENFPVFPKRTDASINRKQFNLDKIRELLNSLDHHKSCGADKISPYVLRECSDALAFPLQKLFQNSHDQGEVPFQWKNANVTPIHKKGSLLDPANYRPVSLTSVPCKVMERLIRDFIVEFLEKKQTNHKGPTRLCSEKRLHFKFARDF